MNAITPKLFGKPGEITVAPSGPDSYMIGLAPGRLLTTPGPAGPAGARGADGRDGVGTIGPIGPPGAPGPAGTSNVNIAATENIPAFVAVTTSGKIANSSNLAHLGKVVGISVAAIASGFSGAVQLIGELTNPAWAWTSGDSIFVNGAGLSASAPATGWIKKLGTAKTPTTVIIELEESILL